MNVSVTTSVVRDPGQKLTQDRTSELFAETSKRFKIIKNESEILPKYVYDTFMI